MQLLVSVATASEARAARLGGADVIDAKDPRDGALGAVRSELLGALRNAVGAGRPLSAALGDRGPAALVERRARAAAQVGASFVKLGFRGALAVSQARRRAAAARRGAGPHTGLVLVGYADWRPAHGLEPDALLALAVETGAVGVLLDTVVKDAGLFTRLAPDAIAAWVAPCGLDEDNAPRPEHPRDPGGDRVARDVPGVGERIGGADPAVRREDGEAPGLACGGDLRLLLDQDGPRQTRGQDVRVLIHAEHGHPVRRVVADLDAAEHGADGIGERSASGHDHEPAAWAERGKCLRDEIEGAGFAEESTPHLDDRVNDLCLLRHEGTVS